MSILLSEPFKNQIERFKSDVLKAVMERLSGKAGSSATVSELYSGFNSDLDASALADEEISSARFTLKVLDARELYCFEIIFDVITENPNALMQSKFNNAGIVLRMDVKQDSDDSYILVDSIEIGLLEDLKESIGWVNSGLNCVDLFFAFKDEIQKNQAAVTYVETIKDKFFYVKNVASKDDSIFRLKSGCLTLSLQLDPVKLNLDTVISTTLICKLGLAKTNVKHIKDFTEDSRPQWFFSSSLRRKKAYPTDTLKYPLLRVEKLIHKTYSELPSVSSYIKLIDDAVSHAYYHFNAP